MRRLLLVALLVGGCSKMADNAPATKSSAPAPASIGMATMEPDGTIVLTLRAEGPSGVHGDAQFRYPKSHPKYEETLDHLGGLKPGESKPVPPWPDEK